MKFILIHIQWNAIVGSNCLIFLCNIFICGWVMGIAMDWLGLEIECSAGMAKNLKHSNDQAEFAVPQNKIFIRYSGGYLSSIQQTGQ